MKKPNKSQKRNGTRTLQLSAVRGGLWHFFGPNGVAEETSGSDSAQG